MQIKGHLHVQADKLTEVAPRVALLGAEYRPNLEDALEVGRDGHLLVQLRRLREARRLAEIIGTEDVGAALRFSRDQFRRVDLDETLFEQRLAEERADRRLRAHDRL